MIAVREAATEGFIRLRAGPARAPLRAASAKLDKASARWSGSVIEVCARRTWVHPDSDVNPEYKVHPTRDRIWAPRRFLASW